MVWEDLAEVAPEPVVGGDALVDEVDHLARTIDDDAHPRSQ